MPRRKEEERKALSAMVPVAIWAVIKAIGEDSHQTVSEVVRELLSTHPKILERLRGVGVEVKPDLSAHARMIAKISRACSRIAVGTLVSSIARPFGISTEDAYGMIKEAKFKVYITWSPRLRKHARWVLPKGQLRPPANGVLIDDIFSGKAKAPGPSTPLIWDDDDDVPEAVPAKTEVPAVLPTSPAEAPEALEGTPEALEPPQAVPVSPEPPAVLPEPPAALPEPPAAPPGPLTSEEAVAALRAAFGRR